MKKFKKFFAVLLTLAMVLGMSMTTFAANLDNGSFTVNGLKGKVTVSYAQILKQNATTSKWEFAQGEGTLKWVTEDEAGTKVEENATVESLTGKNVSFANLDGLADLEYTGDKLAANESVTFDNLPAGLYAVKAVDSDNQYVYSFMIASVDYENGQLKGSTLTAKGQKNVPEKTADKNAVVEGEEILFTVKVNYPTFATGSTEREMTIVDTVENGKIITGSVEIKNTEGSNWSSLFNNPKIGPENKLTIELNADAYDYNKAGNEVVITYKVKANDGVYDAVTNKVESKVPDSEGNSHTNQAIVILPKVNVDITKVDEDGDIINNTDNENLTATFTLYKEYKEGEEIPEGKDVETIKVYVDENTPNGADIDVIEVGTVSTVNGVATFTGLEPDASKATYYVKETAAPNGYSLEPLARELTGAKVTPGEADTVTKDGVTTTTTTNTAEDFKSLAGFGGLNFTDTSIGSLPSTGGIGTTIFTIGGCLIMIIAAGLFFASRRKADK